MTSTGARDEVERAAPEDDRAASPLARHMARQAGIDVTSVAGSGREGRVLAMDVKRHVGAHAATPAPDAPGPAPSAAAESRIEAAARLPLAELQALERVLNREPESEGRVSLAAVMVKLAATALARVPGLNASWHSGVVERHDAVHVGLIPAGGDGMTTLVLHNADRRGLNDLAAAAALASGTGADAGLRGAKGPALTVQPSAPFAGILDPRPAPTALLSVDLPPSPGAADSVCCTLRVDARVADRRLVAHFLEELHRLAQNPRRLLL